MRDDVSAEEEVVLRAMISGIKDVGADVNFVRADIGFSVINILIEDLMCRYQDLRHGAPGHGNSRSWRFR